MRALVAIIRNKRSDLGLSTTAFALILFALVMQYRWGLEPCPLCMVQRLFFLLLGVFYLLVFSLGSTFFLRAVGYSLCLVSSLLGLTFALRHVWLQYLPKDQLPGCIPSLGYLVDTFPFFEAAARIFQGSADCGDVSWTFFGLSIPEQASLFFLAFFIVSFMKLFFTCMQSEARAVHYLDK